MPDAASPKCCLIELAGHVIRLLERRVDIGLRKSRPLVRSHSASGSGGGRATRSHTDACGKKLTSAKRRAIKGRARSSAARLVGLARAHRQPAVVCQLLRSSRRVQAAPFCRSAAASFELPSPAHERGIADSDARCNERRPAPQPQTQTPARRKRIIAVVVAVLGRERAPLALFNGRPASQPAPCCAGRNISASRRRPPPILSPFERVARAEKQSFDSADQQRERVRMPLGSVCALAGASLG
jgi:hypothetical protein